MSGKPLTKGRRGRGEGTIEQRGPKSWRLRVYVGADPVTGRPRQISRTVHAATKTEALKALRQLSAEAEDIRAKDSEASVAYLLAEYQRHAMEDLRDTTAQDYARIIKNHLGPELGAIRLRDLTAYHLDRYITKKRQELKPRTIRLHMTVMSVALERAVSWEWIGINPTRSVTLPRLDTPTRVRVDVDEVRSLIEAAADDRELATGVMLLAITGCRRGEICGLRWPDVDWQTGMLTVSRQRVPVKGGDQTAPLKQKEPDWSKRISLGPLGMAVLQRYRQWTLERADELGVEPCWDGWLLSRDCGRSPLNARGFGTAVSDLGARAKVPVTPHAFRRFAATQMVAAGVDVMTAASRLGHDPRIMLKVYAAALPVRDRAAAEQLEGLVLSLPDERIGAEQ